MAIWTSLSRCVKIGFRLLQFKEDFDITVQFEGGEMFLKALNGNVG
jgi:hypothetical protein